MVPLLTSYNVGSSSSLLLGGLTGSPISPPSTEPYWIGPILAMETLFEAEPSGPYAEVLQCRVVAERYEQAHSSQPGTLQACT